MRTFCVTKSNEREGETVVSKIILSANNLMLIMYGSKISIFPFNRTEMHSLFLVGNPKI